MNYYNEIKKELVNNEIYKKVKNYSKNKNDLQTYYNVGKLIIYAQGGETRAKYGDKLIKEYSVRLTNELGKGYSIRSLKYMRKFFLLIQKGQSSIAQLSWTHYIQILTIKNKNEIDYYTKISIEQNLSVRDLRKRIKSNEYERLDNKTKTKLSIKNKEDNIQDFIKNPIIINNKNSYNIVSEKLLQKLIVEDIENFMKELGKSFCYIGNEYKIRLGNNFNYIDLLLFNIQFNCYVLNLF